MFAVYLCAVFLVNFSLIFAQNLTESDTTKEEITETSTDPVKVPEETEIAQNYTFIHTGIPEEIVLPSDSGTHISHPSIFQNTNKKIPLQLIHHFFDSKIVKPIGEKLSKINAIANHPNYGGIQLLSPQSLWEKLNQKGHHFLTSANGAVFGFGQSGNHDYPFPYRTLNQANSKRNKRNYLKDKLDNYTEGYKNNFTYDFNLIKLNESETYKFPFMIGEKTVKEFMKNVSGVLEN